jgi:hypothetical protein
MLQKIQRATTRPQFIRFLFVLIVVILLLAGISRTVFAQDEPPSIPEFQGTIIDDNSESFILVGPDRFWHESEAGYQDHSWWTKNNDSGIQNSARWILGIDKAGTYQLAVYIPSEHATSNQAHYYVHHQGQITEIIVDQALNQNTWDPLGTFEFAGDGQEYVELTDETGEADSDFELAFDAVGYRPDELGFEDLVADALWDKIKIWLDEKAAEFKPHLEEWLENQKGRLLRDLGNALTGWIDEQCTGLGAAMLLPGFALVLWRKRRRDG